ncbi:MAG: ribosome small subunit-dependent GTPase A [Anaerovoracaceae bacterium]
MEGLIIKGIAGFYYVKTHDGKVYQCKARGLFKKKGITPFVGDNVIFEILEDGDGIIDEILPRKNQYIRPPIANIDMFVVVTSATSPQPNPRVIDKFLVMAEKSQAEIILCINKIDIATKEEIENLKDIYGNIYKMIFVSGEKSIGIEQLRNALSKKKTAFAGPSGVGKSTLINKLEPRMNLETGEISAKTNRGKHTTRHVEIFDMSFGGMIFDTPGFTAFDVLEAEAAELQFLYPEMDDYIGECRFDNCRHLKEPGCAVLNAKDKGDIHNSRYESYKSQMEEIINQKK